eukprot:g1909.t1
MSGDNLSDSDLAFNNEALLVTAADKAKSGSSGEGEKEKEEEEKEKEEKEKKEQEEKEEKEKEKEEKEKEKEQEEQEEEKEKENADDPMQLVVVARMPKGGLSYWVASGVTLAPGNQDRIMYAERCWRICKPKDGVSISEHKRYTEKSWKDDFLCGQEVCLQFKDKHKKSSGWRVARFDVQLQDTGKYNTLAVWLYHEADRKKFLGLPSIMSHIKFARAMDETESARAASLTDEWMNAEDFQKSAWTDKRQGNTGGRAARAEKLSTDTETDSDSDTQSHSESTESWSASVRGKRKRSAMSDASASDSEENARKKSKIECGPGFESSTCDDFKLVLNQAIVKCRKVEDEKVLAKLLRVDGLSARQSTHIQSPPISGGM